MATLRNRLFNGLAVLLVCGMTLVASRPARAVEIDFSRYAAVAYSESTGEYGYGWDHASRGAAERTALAHCKASDAKIVGWVKAGWLVLAVGEDKAYGVAWQWGPGATNREAAEEAQRKCHAKGQRVKTYVILCSGDVAPEIVKVALPKASPSVDTAKK